MSLSGCATTKADRPAHVPIPVQTTTGSTVAGAGFTGNALKLALHSWFDQVTPIYKSLQQDLAQVNKAVATADKAAIRNAGNTLNRDASRLEALPASPDAQSQSGLNQAVKYVRVGAAECIKDEYVTGTQDLENARQWAVAVVQRVNNILAGKL